MAKAAWQGAAILAVCCSFVRVAGAQSLPRCTFDAATRTATVRVDGTATVRRDNNIIWVGGVGCGMATVQAVERIVVQGGSLNDSVTFSGNFEPGHTPEQGTSEVELEIDLGPGDPDLQTVRIDRGDNDRGFTAARFGASGIDLYGDGDEDVALSGSYRVVISAGHREVDFDATLYPGRLVLGGSPGDDVLLGGPAADQLDGNGGNDLIDGGEGDDRLSGGPVLLGQAGHDTLTGYGQLEGGPGDDTLTGDRGDDILIGGDGDDRFLATSSFPPGLDGADQIVGGSGLDTMSYAPRLAWFDFVPAAVVTLDGLPNDGDPAGEGDNVGTDVENLIGTAGNDILVGSSSPNQLLGGAGNDELYGEGGSDTLEGQDGDDFLEAGEGDNTLRGAAGNDTLVGGLAGTDAFFGGDGDDQIFATTDGRVENIKCGAGIDLAEGNAEDRFAACESLDAFGPISLPETMPR